MAEGLIAPFPSARTIRNKHTFALSTFFFMYYLPFHCLSFLTLPVLAVCVNGSPACFVVDPLQAQLCLTREPRLSIDIDRGSHCVFESPCLYFVQSPSQRTSPYVNPTALFSLSSHSPLLVSLPNLPLVCIFILILAALLWCFSVSNNGEYGSLCVFLFFFFFKPFTALQYYRSAHIPLHVRLRRWEQKVRTLLQGRFISVCKAVCWKATLSVESGTAVTVLTVFGGALQWCGFAFWHIGGLKEKLDQCESERLGTLACVRFQKQWCRVFYYD